MTDHASIPDLRQKTTLTAQRFLQEGYHVLLVAGPKMGKTFMRNRLLIQIPDLEVIDLRQQSETFFKGTVLNLDSLTRYLAEKKKGILLILSTARYFRSGCPNLSHTRRIPLICCMPRDLRKSYPDLTDLFDQTLGHPYLVQGVRDNCIEKNTLELQVLWRDLLKDFPETIVLLNDLIRHRTLDPIVLYQRTVEQFENHRFNLDLLCNAGLITRMLYEEAAGIRIQLGI